MNILRLSTLTLTLAVAVITLGYASYSSAAPPCSKNPRPGCRPDNGDPPATETKFTVEMLEFDGDGVETIGECVGLNKGSKLSAVFPGNIAEIGNRVGCEVFTISGGVKLYLGEIAVSKKNTRVILFFTSDPSVQFPGNETGYQTLRLVAMPASLLGVITLKVDAGEVLVTKSHQPDKGLPVGTIDVGKFVYTPVPE